MNMWVRLKNRDERLQANLETSPIGTRLRLEMGRGRILAANIFLASPPGKIPLPSRSSLWLNPGAISAPKSGWAPTKASFVLLSIP